jgi:hypothetical protein
VATILTARIKQQREVSRSRAAFGIGLMPPDQPQPCTVLGYQVMGAGRRIGITAEGPRKETGRWDIQKLRGDMGLAASYRGTDEADSQLPPAKVPRRGGEGSHGLLQDDMASAILD